MQQSATALRVQMLGGFSLYLNGEPLELEMSNTKRQLLLQLLLYSRYEGIPRQKLLEYLYGEEDDGDANNNLKALIFRLRKQLDKKLHGSCIGYRNGAYYWQGPAYILDAAEFKEQATIALTLPPQQAAEPLRQAALLYTGAFLPDFPAIEWIAVTAVHLSELFGRCVRTAGRLFDAAGDQSARLELFEYAARLEPEQEEWQLGCMDALRALGRAAEALERYHDYVQFLFDNLGLEPDELLLAQLQKINASLGGTETTMESICEDLPQPASGAFYCSYPRFRDSYALIARIAQRSGQSSFLVLVTLTDVHGRTADAAAPRVQLASEQLREVIGASLRNSDVYACYGVTRYLMLLTGLRQEDCAVVEQRVSENFDGCKESWGFRLKFRVVPIKRDASGLPAQYAAALQNEVDKE